LFQHLFWFFGHPEVYIIILPVFGLVSTLIEINSGKAVFSTLGMIYSMSSISLLGFFVWAHHMFTVGLDLDSRTYFGSITLVIGVPTCIKIFNWIYSVCCSDLLVWMEMYFVYMFIFMFIIGGITGLVLANVGLDVLLHDTYFVVAHFHYVLSLGATVGVMSGFLHYITRWLFVEYSFLFVMCCFFLVLTGSNFVFFPLHLTGLLSFPRRISDYPISYAMGYNSIIVFVGMIFLCFVVISFCYIYIFGFCYNVCFFYLYNFVFCLSFLSFFMVTVISYIVLVEFLHWL